MRVLCGFFIFLFFASFAQEQTAASLIQVNKASDRPNKYNQGLSGLTHRVLSEEKPQLLQTQEGRQELFDMYEAARNLQAQEGEVLKNNPKFMYNWAELKEIFEQN